MTALSYKVAIVTGASRGIGRATAERLARDGAAVVVNYATSFAEAGAVVESITADGGKAIAVQANIGKLSDIERLFSETMAHFGRLDIFVANAGYFSLAPLADTTEEEFDRVYAINAKGTFFCLQQAVRHMADGGRIVCVSTIGTIANMPGGSCYFGSKAAIEQFCRVLAKEVAPRGIAVNAISPGFTDTDLLQRTLAAEDPAVATQIVEMTPFGRFGEPAEIADAIAFLVGPDARWITRQNLAVDGGIISR
jgi:3-oxoacyl-[acyl-carrier protein] reductase